MLVEASIVVACAYALNQVINRDTIKLRKKWNSIMSNAKSEGIRNKNGDSFELLEIEKVEFGYKCTVSIPFGLSHTALFNAKEIIEDNLGCMIELVKKRFKNYITMDIIEDSLGDIKFEPYETKANELFLGYRYNGEPYLIDLTKDPHLLIAGKTGTGKSVILSSILTNLVYYHSREIELYLLQKKKGDINIFSECPNVKFLSNTEDEIKIALEKINSIIDKRSIMFVNQGIKNIDQWNKHYPKRAMKRIVVVAEEVSFFMEDESKEIFKYFTDTVKAGRSAGIHFIGLTQRTTAANLGGDGELKSQLTVVTARQRSELDSRNAIDISDAAYLEEQEFISSCNDGYIYFKSCWVDEDFNILNKYVPEIKVPKKGIKLIESKSDANLTIVNKLDDKEIEHQKWCQERGIKIIEIDLAKEKSLKKEIARKEEEKKVNIIAPNQNTNNKKGKVSLKEVAISAEAKG